MDVTGPSLAQQQVPPEETMLLCAAAAAMHPLPQSSSPSIFASSPTMRSPTMGRPSVPEEHAWPAMQEPRRIHMPVPGEYVSGNLWNLPLIERDVPGPLGSPLRHTTTMQSPMTPNYVATQKFPCDTTATRAYIAEYRCSSVLPRILAV